MLLSGAVPPSSSVPGSAALGGSVPARSGTFAPSRLFPASRRAPSDAPVLSGEIQHSAGIQGSALQCSAALIASVSFASTGPLGGYSAVAQNSGTATGTALLIGALSFFALVIAGVILWVVMRRRHSEDPVQNAMPEDTTSTIAHDDDAAEFETLNPLLSDDGSGMDDGFEVESFE
jgi:hypothetical protein